MNDSSEQKPSFEIYLRRTFGGLLNKIGGFLLQKGIKPNQVTLACLFGNIIAAILVASGRLTWGGIAALLVAPLDAVDGAMARLLNQKSKFGAFLDSVTDRYDEMILLGGVLFYFSTHDNFTGVMLTFLAMCGSFLVSYTRARAESLGFSGKVGLLTRIERSVVMIIGLLLRLPIGSVGIIAVLANFTAIQRIISVWKQARIADTNLS